jgi:hypothetical protein
MADLLDRVHGEIRARLRASEDAVREYERLEAALVALSGDAAAAPRLSAMTRAPAPRGRSASPARRAKRAPRGANRAAALRAIAEHPGAGVADVVAATGIKRGVLYALLGRLVDEGEIRKQSLPGDATGYALENARASDAPIAETDAPAGSPASVPSAVQAEASTASAGAASAAPEARSTTSPHEPASGAASPSPGPGPAPGDDGPVPVSSDSAHRESRATHGERPGGTEAQPAVAERDTAASARGRRKPKARPAARKGSAAQAKPSRPRDSQRTTPRRGRGKPKPKSAD